MTLSAEQLHQLAWSVPVRQLAAELGFSDTGLRKAMRARGIPTPSRRYWVRTFAGLPVERESLPTSAVSAPPLKLRHAISSQLSSWLNAESSDLPRRAPSSGASPDSAGAPEPPLKRIESDLRTSREGQGSSPSATKALSFGESRFAALDHRALSEHQLRTHAVRVVESQLQRLSPPARCLAETWLAEARLDLFQNDPIRALLDSVTRGR